MEPWPDVRRMATAKELLVILAIWIAGFFIYGTSLPYDYDSINYALAIVDAFNPSLHQPHPPGYFFHVMFGKLLHGVMDNPFRILEIQGIAYLTILLVTLFSVPAAPGSRLFLSTLPLLLFFPGAPVIYAALVGFSALLCVQAIAVVHHRGNPVLLVAIHAVATGFRQDLSLFLLPVVLYALWVYRPTLRQIALMVAVFSACTALWFVPTMLASARSPIGSSSDVFGAFAKGSSLFLGAPPSEALRWGMRFMFYGIGVLGPAGIGYLVFSWKRASPGARRLLLVGTLPCLLFGLFIHAPKPGYYGAALGFFLVWSLWAARPVLQRRWWIALTLCNILFFAVVPPMQFHASGSLQDKVASRFSAIGACGAGELSRAKATMRRLDAVFSGCGCVDPHGVATDLRIFSYLAKYRWRASIGSGNDSGCCGMRDQVPPAR